MPPDSFEAIDRRDIRVIQRGEDFRLALEPGQPLGVTGNRLGSTLMATARFRLVSRRAVHFAHPAHANLGGDFIRAEARAGGESQSFRGLYGRGGRAERITPEHRRSGFRSSAAPVEILLTTYTGVMSIH